MGLFDGADLNNAPLTGGGVRFRPGQYVVEIVEQSKISTRKKGDAFSTRFRVLEAIGDGQENKVGTEADEFIMMDLDWGPANAKRLLIAANGLDAFGAEDADAVSQTNWNQKLVECIMQRTLVGNKLRVKCYPKKKKNSDETYDRVEYLPHEETRAKLQKSAKPLKK